MIKKNRLCVMKWVHGKFVYRVIQIGVP